MKNLQLISATVVSIALLISAAMVSSALKHDDQVSSPELVQPRFAIPLPQSTTQQSIIDLLAADETLAAGDIVEVSVNDLLGPGVESKKVCRIGVNGKIHLWYIGDVPAAGGNSNQLEKSIADAYKSGQIIVNAMVTVTSRRPGRGS